MGARRVVLGLGSNLGDRRANLEEAARRLAADLALNIVAASTVFETPPDGGPPQGDYLNAAVLALTSEDAAALLGHAALVEVALGRTRVAGERNGPRTLDVDILWIEGELIADGDIDVPHPRLDGRPFAVQPLVELAPDARDPRTGRLYAELPVAREALTALGLLALPSKR